MQDSSQDDEDFVVMDEDVESPKRPRWPEWRQFVTMIMIAVGVTKLTYKFDPILLGIVVAMGLLLIHGYIKNFKGYRG